MRSDPTPLVAHEDDAPVPYVPGLDERRWRLMRWWQELDACLAPAAPADLVDVTPLAEAGWTPYQAASLLAAQRAGDAPAAGVEPGAWDRRPVWH